MSAGTRCTERDPAVADRSPAAAALARPGRGGDGLVRGSGNAACRTVDSPFLMVLWFAQ
jgi:hypothetical protein